MSQWDVWCGTAPFASAAQSHRVMRQGRVDTGPHGRVVYFPKGCLSRLAVPSSRRPNRKWCRTLNRRQTPHPPCTATVASVQCTELTRAHVWAGTLCWRSVSLEGGVHLWWLAVVFVGGVHLVRVRARSPAVWFDYWCAIRSAVHAVHAGRTRRYPLFSGDFPPANINVVCWQISNMANIKCLSQHLEHEGLPQGPR